MANIIIYTRVSSKSQITFGHGLDSQKKLCEEWANKNNHHITAYFQDGGVSGKFSSRVGLDEMIAYIKQQNKNMLKIEFVVVDDFDRIIRDVAGWWDIKAKIESSGCKIFSLKQRIEDTPEGHMFQSIAMSFKQYERENNARRVKERQRARMLDGFRPLYAPPGYKTVFADPENKRGGKQLVFDQPLADLIKQALLLYADGIVNTQKQMINYLNTNGAKSRFGKTINKNFVNRLLDNNRLLFYAGYINYPDRDIKMIKAKHEALISLDIVDKIKQRYLPKARNSVFSTPEILDNMILRNMLYCEHCGKPLSGGPSPNKQGKYYYYYRCFCKDCFSYGKSLNAKSVHKSLEQHLQKFKIKQSHVDLTMSAIKDLHEQENALAQLSKDKHIKQIKSAQNKIDKLNALILNTESAQLIQNYQTQLESTIQEKIMLEEKIKAGTEIKYNQKELDEILDFGMQVLKDPYKIYKMSDTQTKRFLISVVFDGKVFYNKKSGITTPQIPLFYEVFHKNNHEHFQDLGQQGFEPWTTGLKGRCSTNGATGP